MLLNQKDCSKTGRFLLITGHPIIRTIFIYLHMMSGVSKFV